MKIRSLVNESENCMLMYKYDQKTKRINGCFNDGVEQPQKELKSTSSADRSCYFAALKIGNFPARDPRILIAGE